MSYVVKRVRSYVTTNKNAFDNLEYIGRFDHECVYESCHKIYDGIVYTSDDLDEVDKFCNKYMFGNFVELYTYDKAVVERDMLYIYECDENGNISNQCIDDYYQDIVVRDIDFKYN